MRHGLLLVSSFCLFAVSGCKTTEKSGSETLLINATVTTADHAAARSTVMMARKSGKLCTGTLLHPRLVLTAAHCVDNLVLEDEPTSVLFALDVTAGVDTPMVKVEKFFRHKDYKGVPPVLSPLPMYDIAVLILSEDAPGTHQPAILPSTNVPVSVNEQMLLVGAGQTDANDPASATVMHHKPFRVSNVAVQRGELEFLPMTAGGACGGDSGGPAYKVMGNQLVVLGVASRVVNGCMSTVYYTDTRAFHNWIKQFETDVGGSFKYTGGGGGGGGGSVPGTGFKLGVTLSQVTWSGESWVMFKTVDPNGRAAAAGIRAGDLIKRIHDQKIYTEADFDQAMAAAVATGAIQIKYLKRQGQQFVDAQVVINAGGTNPSPVAPTPAPTAFKLGVGIEVIFWNNENWVRFKTVNANGPAGQYGLQPGDLVKRINEVQIYDTAGFDQAMAAAVQSGTVRIKFRRFLGNQASDGEVAIPVGAQ